MVGEKKILMLGASGFIGRNLLGYLRENYTELDVDAPSSKELDISDESAVTNALETKYYDIIIHAAVYNPRTSIHGDHSRELDMNLRMYLNFSRNHNLFGKMLYFGSGAEYDKRLPIVNIDETSKGNGIPTSDYGLYKYIINESIMNSENIYNLRVFGLFGKYENWKSTFISGACCKALKKVPITIRKNVYFDYLYIDDFCRMVEWFLFNEPKFKVYNVTSGKKIDLISLAAMVNQVSRSDVPVYVCEQGLANEYTANNERILREMGEFRFTDFEPAIKNLFEWYRSHETSIDLASLLYQ